MSNRNYADAKAIIHFPTNEVAEELITPSQNGVATFVVRIGTSMKDIFVHHATSSYVDTGAV